MCEKEFGVSVNEWSGSRCGRFTPGEILEAWSAPEPWRTVVKKMIMYTSVGKWTVVQPSSSQFTDSHLGSFEWQEDDTDRNGKEVVMTYSIPKYGKQMKILGCLRNIRREWHWYTSSLWKSARIEYDIYSLPTPCIVSLYPYHILCRTALGKGQDTANVASLQWRNSLGQNRDTWHIWCRVSVLSFVFTFVCFIQNYFVDTDSQR